MAVQTQIQTRRGTAASWTSTNPTLAAGEIGFESDTNKFKIGTGSTAWASLPYAASTSPLTTKGDLYTYSTADARLAVGNNGETIVADSSTSTGLRYQASMAGGKNVLLNSNFAIAQRGTSISVSGSNIYTLDRWAASPFGSGQPFTVSQQTATPPTSTRNYLQIVGNSTNWTNIFITQSLETADVVKLQGKTVTLSFQYKVPTNFTATWSMNAFWGTATDTAIYNSNSGTSIFGTVLTNNAGWVSASQTFVVPSTATQLSIMFVTLNNVVNNATFQIANVMLELGSVATAFQTATGTIQGELAACQRYYFRTSPASAQRFFGSGFNQGTVTATASVVFPVEMRTRPTALEQSGTASDYAIAHGFGVETAMNAVPTFGTYTTNRAATINGTVASGLTAGQGSFIISNGSNAYLGWSAEL